MKRSFSIQIRAEKQSQLNYWLRTQHKSEVTAGSGACTCASAIADTENWQGLGCEIRIEITKGGRRDMRRANLDGEVVDGGGGGGGGGHAAEQRESGADRAEQRRRGGGEGGGAERRLREGDGEARAAARQQRGGRGDDGASQEAEAMDERGGARRHRGSETGLYSGNRGCVAAWGRKKDMPASTLHSGV